MLPSYTIYWLSMYRHGIESVQVAKPIYVLRYVHYVSRIAALNGFRTSIHPSDNATGIAVVYYGCTGPFQYTLPITTT